ncbi:MAG: GspE/PulE family protein [Patescibacteria group bacterium]
MAITLGKITDLLVKEGVVKKEEVATLEEEAKQLGATFSRYLISQGRLTEKRLNEIISTFLNVPIFDIKERALKPEFVELLPEAIARQRQLLIVDADQKKKTYSVAMTDPTDIDTLTFLAEYLNGTIDPYLISSEDLRFGFRIYKKKSSAEFQKIINERIKELRTTLKRGAEGNILENVPLVQLFDAVMDYAAILDASDIYFQPEEELLRIRFRVDGLLRDIFITDKAINDGIIARAKTLSALRIDEHVKPQDGRFRFRTSDTDLDIRVAIMPTFFGEKLTLRLLAGSQSFLTFEELGVSDVMAQKLYQTVKRPYGMLLSAGPTGSGKTTTIYSILTLLNRPEVHIATIEDPIEYMIPNVSQTQVNVQANITFASGLRALLRHSPDVILIGETRDAETASISINAALTGHLLISSIHTNNAPSAVVRLLDLGIPSFLIASTLNAVVAQRLGRKICQNCIESYPTPPSIAKQIQEEFARAGKKNPPPKKLYRGKGCTICDNTGYKGRTGIFEILVVSEKIRDIIAGTHFTLDSLSEMARAEGMTTMFEDGLEKVERGVTTIEELFRIMSAE